MQMRRMKRGVRDVLENPGSRYFSVVNDILAFATILSIVTIVLETAPAFGPYHAWFLTVEWVVVALFSLEYAARFFIAEPKSGYVVSFFGIVDLIAILPTFLGLGNFTFFKSARFVRLMRFLRMVRLAKLSQAKMKDVEETMGALGFNIALYAVALLFVMILIGALLHAFMPPESGSWSIPAGMYWAFAVFLGGLPAPIPPGTSGLVIFIFAKLCGMILFGFLIGVVGKVFNQLILGKGKGK